VIAEEIILVNNLLVRRNIKTLEKVRGDLTLLPKFDPDLRQEKFPTTCENMSGFSMLGYFVKI
jgi:hypothetical protein